jgi:hypothetical protein
MIVSSLLSYYSHVSSTEDVRETERQILATTWDVIEVKMIKLKV